jgi:hypothetical protein
MYMMNTKLNDLPEYMLLEELGLFKDSSFFTLAKRAFKYFGAMILI